MNASFFCCIPFLNIFSFCAGLSIDLETSIPANGSLGGSKHSGHHIGQEKSCSCLLFVLVEIENLTHWRFVGCEFGFYLYRKYLLINFFFRRFCIQQVERRNGWINVGDLQGAVHFKIVKYERIKFLVIALKDSIEIYAWAPKPYHKFMAFKVMCNFHKISWQSNLILYNCRVLASCPIDRYWSISLSRISQDWRWSTDRPKVFMPSTWTRPVFMMFIFRNM